MTGDMLSLAAGPAFRLVLTSDSAQVDRSALTEESDAFEVRTGAIPIAGDVVLTGPVTLPPASIPRSQSCALWSISSPSPLPSQRSSSRVLGLAVPAVATGRLFCMGVLVKSETALERLAPERSATVVWWCQRRCLLRRTVYSKHWRKPRGTRPAGASWVRWLMRRSHILTLSKTIGARACAPAVMVARSPWGTEHGLVWAQKHECRLAMRPSWWNGASAWCRMQCQCCAHGRAPARRSHPCRGRPKSETSPDPRSASSRAACAHGRRRAQRYAGGDAGLGLYRAGHRVRGKPECR